MSAARAAAADGAGAFADLPRPGIESGPDGIDDPAPRSPVEPVRLGLDDPFRFRCHKGIPCFNACCENADILLAPYDILRLRKRLRMTAREFIDCATIDHAMDAHGMPGLKLARKEGSTACVFLTAEGCAVYEDRPSACRYYALGLLSMRRSDAAGEEESYFAVKEAHCLGHLENRVQTVREYLASQGLDRYDRMNREWRQIVLKKRSAGPASGRPTRLSFDLFYLASYDLDGFRAFVSSAGFRELFDLDDGVRTALMADDERLLAFAYRFLKQALFGEASIPVNADAAARRTERFKAKAAARAREAAARREAGPRDARPIEDGQ